ncbi:MAG: tetrahydromethanopterin S-methyltransferase subunit F [Candidatus Methanoperedens sp.]
MTDSEQEYGKGVPMVIKPSMAVIESLVEDMRYRGQLIARNQKLESAVGATGVIGFALGFFFAVFMILGPRMMGA